MIVRFNPFHLFSDLFLAFIRIKLNFCLYLLFNTYTLLGLLNIGMLSILKNENFNICGLDIGGTLIKFCYFVKSEDQTSLSYSEYNEMCSFESLSIKLDDIKLYLIMECYDKNPEIFIRKNLTNKVKMFEKVYLTGGGAYKYKKILKKCIDTELIQVSEFEALVNGIKFFSSSVQQPLLYSNQKASDDRKFFSFDEITYPLLIINIGSGISFFKIESFDDYQRIGGSSISGNTIIGLNKLLREINNNGLVENDLNDKNNEITFFDKPIESSDIIKSNLIKIPSNFTKKNKTLNKPYTHKKIVYKYVNLMLEDLEKPSDRPTDKICYAICDNISRLSFLYKLSISARSMIFCGGFFHRSSFEPYYILSLTKFYSNYYKNIFRSISFNYQANLCENSENQCFFLKFSNYISAIGALVSEIDKHVCSIQI